MLDPKHQSLHPLDRQFGEKEWARLEQSFEAPIIHISNATPHREYFHHTGLQPLYARLNHPTPGFCFNRSADREVERQLHPSERGRGEGVVHIALKHALRVYKGITIRVDGELRDIVFETVRLEYIPKPPNNRWRIDAVCTIKELEGQEDIRKKFGGGLNVEFVCHKGVNAEKERFLKTLPYAAIVMWPYAQMQREIEEENRNASSSSQVRAYHHRWQSRSIGFLRKESKRELIHIPGEGDPRVWSDGLNPPKSW